MSGDTTGLRPSPQTWGALRPVGRGCDQAWSTRGAPRGRKNGPREAAILTVSLCEQGVAGEGGVNSEEMSVLGKKGYKKEKIMIRHNIWGQRSLESLKLGTQIRQDEVTSVNGAQVVMVGGSLSFGFSLNILKQGCNVM